MAVLTVARDLDPLDDTLARVAIVLATVSLATVLLIPLTTAIAIRRGLAPLNELAASIQNLSEDDLSAQVELTAMPPAELLPVIQRLNDLLRRLKAVVERERAFTAEVAHELRTPLAGLTTALEVCAAQPRDAIAYRRTIARCLSAAGSMRGMVERLLLLARADAGQLVASLAPMALREAVIDAWEPWTAVAGRRELTADIQLPADLRVMGDAALLKSVLSNLLENAVSYADTGGRVRVFAEPGPSAEQLTLGIENTASTVTAADAEQAFERFWRGDAARSDAGSHSGLGLPLCRKLASVMGGTITAISADGQFRVYLSLARAGRQSLERADHDRTSDMCKSRVTR